MDEYQFRALKHRSKEIRELDPSKDTLKTLQSDLVVKGEFHTTIRNKNRGAKSKFLVIERKMDSPPLPNKNTLTELGMIKIDPDGTLKETNELRIKSVKPPDDINALLRQTETVTRQSKSNQEMQPSRKQRSRPEFSGNGRLLGQLHQQLCGHSSTTLSDDPERHKIKWEKEEEKSFRN
ncbi:unnamed protein product [Porites evermanni]|uniref:Uncharacterized protein n=1 Tax=Porites evermanni TaxID=104178 RepID=A0ABN8QKQ1_9CNID|nr:unnamed protein product [Porites evermanni]